MSEKTAIELCEEEYTKACLGFALCKARMQYINGSISALSNKRLAIETAVEEQRGKRDKAMFHLRKAYVEQEASHE